MKKTVLLLVLGLASFSLSAQSRMSYSLEFVAGVGVGNGFRIGAGVGTRFARPCLQYITRNGSKSRDFCNELDIPVFLRLGYGKEKLYANLDAGYAIGALALFDWGWKPGGRTEPIYNGFFVEPQVGWRVGRRSALALGLLIQQSTVSNHVTTENGTWGDPSYSIRGEVNTLNVFTPAVTLRYVVGF